VTRQFDDHNSIMTQSMDMNFSFCELNILFNDLPYLNRALWILVWALDRPGLVSFGFYNIVTDFPLDIINFFICYALSGRAWDLISENKVGTP
jgi:hypothetical protein